MFYCSDCQIKNDWPKSIAKSIGNCEMCGKHSSICNDTPSSRLPKQIKFIDKNTGELIIKNSRLHDNKIICSQVLEFLEKNPHQRFMQALWNLNIINGKWNDIMEKYDIDDKYNEESSVTKDKLFASKGYKE